MENQFFLHFKKRLLCLKIVKNLYERFYNTPIYNFISNLSIIFFFYCISSVFQRVSGIIVARKLSIIQFGFTGIAGSICAFASIPMCLGLNSAMYKFLPDSSEKSYQRYTSTALVLQLGIIAIVFTCIFICKGVINTFLKIDIEVWFTGLLFTVSYNLYSLSESFLRGKKLYVFIGKLKLLYSALTMLLLLFFFIILNKTSFQYNYFAIIISQLIFIFVSLLTVRASLFDFSISISKKLLRYGIFITANSLCNILLTSSDLIILNYFYSGDKIVGIYTAYQGSIKGFFTVLFYEVFTVVFFPTIANMNKIDLVKKLHKKMIIIIPVTFLGAVLSSSFTILLYGKNYKYNIIYIVLTSISITFYSIFQLYNTVFNMEEKKGIKIGLISLLIVIPVSLGMQFFMIQYFNIIGALCAVTFTNVLLVVVYMIILAVNYKDIFNHLPFFKKSNR